MYDLTVFDISLITAYLSITVFIVVFTWPIIESLLLATAYFALQVIGGLHDLLFSPRLAVNLVTLIAILYLLILLVRSAGWVTP